MDKPHQIDAIMRHTTLNLAQIKILAQEEIDRQDRERALGILKGLDIKTLNDIVKYVPQHMMQNTSTDSIAHSVKPVSKKKK